MKLRQKLAVVLASAMVVTAVPVITMAKSTSTVSKVVTVEEDKVLTTSDAPTLKVELKDGLTTGANFYLTLDGAEWDETAMAANPIVVKNEKGDRVGQVVRNDDHEATVEIDDTYSVARKDIFFITLTGVKVTEDEAKITVDGDDTEIDNGTFVFAKQSNTDAVVTAKDLETFYTTSSKGTEVGTVVITEAVVGSIGAKSAEDRTITVDLDHSDFEFVSDQVVVQGSKAFSGKKETVTAKMSSDNQTLTLTLPAWTANTKGAYELVDIKVKSTENNPSTGDLTFTVEGKNDTKVESTTVKVATIATYGTILEVDNKDTVKSGKSTKVKLTYKEVTADSVAKSDVDFKIDKGYFTKIPAGATAIYKDSKNKKADELIGFTYTCSGKDADIDKFLDKKEVEIQTKLDTEGEITLTTSGRYVEEQSIVIAEVKPTFTITEDAMLLKVGQSKQIGGKLVLTESEVGAMDKHSIITLKLADEDGINFTELPEVTVSGNGKATSVDWVEGTSKSQIKIDLAKGSTTEPCVITVEGFEVKVDRTVPQGSYDLKVLVDDYTGDKKAKEFFVVGTPNTEELAANGLPKGTATFTINSTEYTVNGKTATMDAAAYIQDPGYTMIPVRYLANAFSVPETDILFSAGTATIFAGSRTIQLTAGSDVAIVNGASIKLSTKVVIKDGRTYVPVGEIARILGISASWDSTTKVATFENK